MMLNSMEFVYHFSSLVNATGSTWESEQPRFLDEGLHSPKELKAIIEHAK